MKREIKFRGRTEQGKWLYGDLVRNQDGRVAIVPPLKGCNNDHSRWEVNPNTIGQYTGLKDKNGNDIYEGDILDCNHFRYEVVWKDGGLMLRYNKVALYQFVSGGACMEVVGNVYDNKDLLTDK